MAGTGFVQRIERDANAMAIHKAARRKGMSDTNGCLTINHMTALTASCGHSLGWQRPATQ
jgi:hypothetical protein